MHRGTDSLPYKVVDERSTARYDLSPQKLNEGTLQKPKNTRFLRAVSSSRPDTYFDNGRATRDAHDLGTEHEHPVLHTQIQPYSSNVSYIPREIIFPVGIPRTTLRKAA